MNDRLTDEQWQDMIDNSPPDLPEWMTNILPITENIIVTPVLFRKEDE